MSDSAVVTHTRTSSRLTSVVKVAFVLFVLVQLAAFIYGVFFALLAVNPLHEMVTSAHVEDALAFENRLLGFTLAPLAYAILAAICPLIGWWIHARVDRKDSDAVGWGGAGLFALVYVLFGLMNQGAMSRMGIVLDALSTLIGLLIIALYVMLFMTVGFVTARIFKLKL